VIEKEKTRRTQLVKQKSTTNPETEIGEIEGIEETHTYEGRERWWWPP